MGSPSFPLVRTKLHIPERRTDRVSRPRLLAQLQPLSPAPLLLVTGPAGFGKTTLVVEWLGQTERLTAWLSLDERDNDFTRFLLYLIAAVQLRIPNFGQGLMASMQNPSPPSGQLAIDALINELADLEQALILVLDDYHLIQNPEIQQGVASLIDYLPGQIQIVITGRTEPDLPLARWRVRGKLAEVTAADLRFDSQEAQSFLHTTMALDLPPAAVAMLEEKTEGWAAALQLAALSVRGMSDPMAAIQDFAGNDRHVADYLVSEVMARQPQELQHFLECSSILEQFNSDLCDELLQTHDSRNWLDRVERENLFLIALDHQREWYRYHHLFGALLRVRQRQRQGEEAMVRLHRRAAHWYAAQGQTDDALRHALAGEDETMAARLVAETPLELLWQAGGLGLVRRWVEELSEPALTQYPRAALMGSIANLLAGDIPATARYLALAENDPGLEGERRLIQAVFVRNQGRMDEALSLLNGAIHQLPPEQWLARTVARMQVAMAYLEMGAMQESTAVLDQMALEIPTQSAAGLSMRIQVAWMHSRLAFLRGDLPRAERVCRQVLAEIDASGQIVPMEGLLYASLAGIAYQRNQLEETQTALDRALYWGERTGITDILFNVYDTQIKLMCVRGERDAAWVSVLRLRTIYEKSNFTEIIQIGQAEEALVHLRLGNLAEALIWAKDSRHALTDAVHPRFQPVYHILAIIHLAAARMNREHNRLDQILALTQQLAQQAEQLGQDFPHISALLLQVQALTLQGKQAAAQRSLVQAVTLAEPGRLMRVFLDCGQAIVEPLQALAADQPTNAFVASLLQAFAQEEAEPNPLPDPLTEREQEVLGLIAAGLSNREIQERMVVSHNTVRTHIKNLYSKLDVSSRTQAVRKGQELGLI